ncbi:hypothetical protein [Streptomyces sp. NPDC088789]|uniref:hypothetical protein n=1 Tax=Streptomyces sp. NPDC088789 TaxID=3365899 RepID=UPI0037F933B3
MTSKTEATPLIEGRGQGLIEPEWIRDVVATALAMRVGVSTRTDIDARITELTVHLSDLVDVLAADPDQAVEDLRRAAHRHMDPSVRPTRETPTFQAYTYMRERAQLTLGLLRVFTARHEAEP